MTPPSLRILVVEDSPADVQLARALLAQCPGCHFEPLVCTSLAELESVYLHDLTRFDAVLFGLRFEGSSGARLLRRLCSSLEGRPLLLCHEHFDLPELGPLADAGVQAVLPKSHWSAEMLPNALLFALEQARCRRSYGLDSLTGLPGRSVWLDRLEHALDRCGRSGALFAAMLVDLDDFKKINDTLGHDAGDQLLRQISQRLRHSVRQHDTVARLGGDEFAVLVEDLPYPDVALHLARKLIADVCLPAHLARATVPVSISVGVAIVSPNQRQLTRDWVQQAADAAMYAAKRAGKRNFSVYTDDMDRALLSSLQLDEDVARAVQRDEFSLHYQPVVALDSGRLVGLESLLRWPRGPRQGVTPEVFVPILERLGLMHRVGSVALLEALMQLGRWRDQTDSDLVMHINLSESQVRDPQLPTLVDRALDQAGVPAEALVLEVSQSVLLTRGAIADAALRPLQARGVRLAVCNFDLGQATHYLQALRPDFIKIRHHLPAQQDTRSEVETAILRAHLLLSRELGIPLIAECIEHDEQLQTLRALGEVSCVQGYLIGSPMLADAIEQECAAYAELLRQVPTVCGNSLTSARPAPGTRLRTALPS